MQSLRMAKLFAFTQVLSAFSYMLKPRNNLVHKQLEESALFACTLLDYYKTLEDEDYLVLADDLITANAEMALEEAKRQGFTDLDVNKYLSLPQIRFLIRDAIEKAGYSIGAITESVTDDILAQAHKRGTFIDKKAVA